jgi:3-oxoacyl-[acyl-carrier-protein] synthase II
MGTSRTPHERIVVTGVGAVTNLGTDAASTWDAMRHGRSGITRFEGPEVDRYAGKWAVNAMGQIKGWDATASGALEAREAKRLDRCTVLGMAAAHEAVRHSGIDFSREDADRCGVVVGSGIGGISTIEEGMGTLMSRGPDRISPYTVPRLMVNATTGNLSIRYGLRGPAGAHATACASSGHAVSDAMSHIRAGHADVMLVGGCEAAITPLCVGAFMTMKALSGWDGDPARASRPFDRTRDGFVLAEGAAFVVVETEKHARARGAHILCELFGSGNSSDAGHITAPDPAGRGAARSMVCALKDAGLNASEIGYVNAHGTSTPLGDKAEVAAVLQVFGDYARRSRGGKLLMSSTKSMHGHCLGASGAVELIACMGAVREGVVPPTINLTEPDDEFDIDLVAREARERPVRFAMDNTFGFGGHNVTLIVGRYE